MSADGENIAVIARDREGKTSPLIGTDNTDRKAEIGTRNLNHEANLKFLLRVLSVMTGALAAQAAGDFATSKSFID